MFSYDVIGNVTAMKDYKHDNGGKSLYRFTEKRYDGFGKVISEAEVDCSGSEPTESQLAAARITYTYDNDDQLIRQHLTLMYPDWNTCMENMDV